MQSLREKFDKSNLYEVIANLPNQFNKAFNEVSATIKSDTKKIIFCGIGGSALPANLLKTYLAVSNANFNIPIKINRDYTLPSVVDKDWCGFFDSYSGNTEETLSALAEAEKIGMKQIVILSHGGQLKEIAMKQGYTFIEIPDYSQPRMSYGYIVGAMLRVFQNSELLDINLAELSTEIEKVMSVMNTFDEQGQALAERMVGKVPVIYTSNVWKYVAMVWKINLNENSKVPSFWNIFPEMNHNEMVGYTNPACEFKTILLKDTNEHEQTQKRMDIFKEVLGDKLETEIIDMPEGSPFYKLVSTLMIGLWSSYYLALLNETDPTPVEIVEKFKGLMK